ncbi:MAG: invertase Pin-like site-specific recombinase [Nocardioides sp.]|nr:invertase Pin-like site-specific recombinase [Nocardioides sp.]
MSTAPTARRCAIYARISVSQEASVSIDRQIEAAEQYAAARGWQVVATFRDDGVSATQNKPEGRVGWQSLTDSAETFDAVIVWKIDRLARRITDFWDTYQRLDAQGRSLVSVMDNLDMTTTMGRIVAGIIAGFAEMEADAIRDRVTDARNYLIREGRVVGGTMPYGWRSIPNPDGKGFVLAQDPDRIDYVRGMVNRAERGDSIYSVVQWLDEVGAPLPYSSQRNRKGTGWSYSTVERMLRSPLLAGMTAFNPGNKKKSRGLDVLRNSDGLPVVDESVAIMSTKDWRVMVASLDERQSPQSKPRALRSKTSALLSGLLVCGQHADTQTRMHRGTTQGRAGYYCPTCHQTITNFEDVLVEQFLWAKGDRVRWSVMEEVHEGGAAMLPEIEHRLTEVGAQLQATDDDAQADRLTTEMANLRAMRREARAKAPNVVVREVRSTQSFGEDWAEAVGVEEQRAILDDAIERVWVVRGRPGRRTAASVLARLVIEWKMPNEVGPLPEFTDAELESWAE